MTRRDVLVSVDVNGNVSRVGELHLGVVRGHETANFVYASEWLASPEHFALAPSLMTMPGALQPLARQALHGPIADSAPDRWGRTLMRREERRRARVEGRAVRTLLESDFLLGVGDHSRQGALRFQLTPTGPFLAAADALSIPPLVQLPRLLAAARDLETDEDADADDSLALMLAPGSSLGGARPKASVLGPDAALWIAKFPRSDDPYNVEAWEGVTLTLARAAGIRVEEFRVRDVAGIKTLLVKRFDRRGAVRIPYLSAMSLLNVREGEQRSYVEIAESLRVHGAAPVADLAELWRRLVFSILVANVDDHLRNHGFLHSGPTGWRLSPLFDVNPVPTDIRPRVLSTSIDVDGDPTANVEIALEVCEQFLLSISAARDILREVREAVAEWRRVAKDAGLTRGEIERMESAFSAP